MGAPWHRAAARLRRAAAPQNTTDSHSETLCIELVIRPRPAQPNRQTEHPLRYQGYLSHRRRAYAP